MFGGHLRGSAAEIFFFGDVRGSFFLIADVRGDVFGDVRGNSGPKMGAGGAGGGQKRAKNAQNGPKWPKMAKMAQNGPKCPKWPKWAVSVPEWYTSGSGATAFDSTGWQKSPEYALIRIPARAGAKSRRFPRGQKSPIFAPRQKSPICQKWQKSPIFPAPVGAWVSSFARSLLEKLSARLSPPR